ncbi:MAG: ACP S-malonyltransferase [Candidatus Omnitrophota bacterium]|nr:ACP S-malonyltransferase [Candidatus Omnitrophota bacterium]
MISVALIFPGQGAQYVGMGKEFYDSSSPAREVFDRADQVLKNGLRDVIFNGPAEKLTATAYCQPGIFTFSMAALKALEAHPKYKNYTVKFTAGLSLGEYSALAAAGNLSFEDTLRLVERRSALMEEATKMNKGSMAAIIGFDKDKLVEICQKTGAEVANFNSPKQIVITGHAAKVEEACKLIKEAGAKTVIPLDVSGAFHSSLMKPAAEKFVDVLETVAIRPSTVSAVSNVDGRSSQDPEVIRRKLAEQITSSVQWVETIQHIASQGVTDFIEIGPGKVLAGLIKRTDPTLRVFNIEKPADIELFP